MPVVDLDYAEYHVSIKDYITGAPYVTSDGRISLDMPYESLELVEEMHEPRQGQLSTAKVRFPSLLAFPELRPLLQQIKEGSRVEIYDFQPDVGNPRFGGFIPPGGITESGGNVIIDVVNNQLRWQHVRRFEYLNANAAGFYGRAMSIWQDLIAEDFQVLNDLTYFTPPNVLWAPGSVTVPNGTFEFTTNQPPFGLSEGDTFLMECDAVWNSTFPGSQDFCEVMMSLGTPNNTNAVKAVLYYRATLNVSFPYAQSARVYAFPLTGPSTSQGGETYQVSWAMPQSHHLACYFKIGADTVTAYYYVDNINIAVLSGPFQPDPTPQWQFKLLANVNNPPNDYVKLTSWRVRKLVPALGKAPRFLPQTPDVLAFQPNNEENLSLLEFIAEKDNAEFRWVYKPWPALDQLELDAVGTLGINQSTVVGYEPTGASPSEGSPQTAPVPVTGDAGAFVGTPPFRLEEGWNLASAPKRNTPSNLHANDVLRMGASTTESQIFSEAWAASETGRPQAGQLGSYPYFEQLTNDDRVGLQTVIKTLAGYELARRIDTTPSLTVEAVGELQYISKLREGDSIYVATRSLLANVEQTMRVMRIRHTAGHPVREIVLGRGEYDPDQRRVYGEALLQNWLYDQSGSSPAIYTYTGVGSYNAGASTPDQTIPLDQYTSGTQLVAAWLHWFTDANVLLLQPYINASPVSLPATSTSNTDSGLVDVTSLLQAAGSYKFHWVNTDVGVRALQSAALILRVKG